MTEPPAASGMAGQRGERVPVIFVVLPAHNEEGNIVELLAELDHTATELAPMYDTVAVVVDDGSTDRTAELATGFPAKRAAGRAPRLEVHVVRHSTNRGLAAALRTGFEYTSALASGEDIVVTMDADNTHPPRLLPSMLRSIRDGRDVVIASRYRRGARVIGLSWKRRFLSRIASLLFRALCPIRSVRDYTCGFRAFRASVLQRALAQDPHFISEKGFTVTADIVLKLRRLRPAVVMGEIPLELRYDRKLGASKMRVFRTIFASLRLISRRCCERR